MFADILLSQHRSFGSDKRYGETAGISFKRGGSLAQKKSQLFG